MNQLMADAASSKFCARVADFFIYADKSPKTEFNRKIKRKNG